MIANIDKLKSLKKYGDDKTFLKAYTSVIELRADNKCLLLSADFQGRVLTSTSDGDNGHSYGWLNYDLIASKKHLPHCNNFGGEDRFWLGPEGGQFSIYFKENDPFDVEHWQTPSCIDTDRWNVVRAGDTEAEFSTQVTLENYSGTALSCRLDRVVRLLSDYECDTELGIKIGNGVSMVGFTSTNTIINCGRNHWDEKSGMLSIWILGQFAPSANNHVIIPYKQSDCACINDRYFGKIDSDRLTANEDVLLFQCDGNKRGKIGIPYQMATEWVGAYDKDNNTLTIVKYGLDTTKTSYVNSMWEIQSEPFCGDVINAYNDGPLDDGSIMGPFYEIETSSAAANIKPEERLTHKHSTFHFSGDIDDLNRISLKILNIDLSKL